MPRAQILKHETMKANAAGAWRALQIACLRLNLARYDGEAVRSFLAALYAFEKCA